MSAMVSIPIVILLIALGWQYRRSNLEIARLIAVVEDLEGDLQKARSAEEQLPKLDAAIDTQSTEINLFSSFLPLSPIEQFIEALETLGYELEGHRLVDEKKSDFYDELVVEIDFSENPGRLTVRGRMPIAAWVEPFSGTTRRAKLYRAAPPPPYTPTESCVVDDLPTMLVPFGKGPRGLRDRAMVLCAEFEAKRYFVDRVKVYEWNREQIERTSAIIHELAKRHGFDELAERLRSREIELR